MANDFEVIRAETVWHCDPSQGVKGSDKVYSVQLVHNKKNGVYTVESQYGKRGSNLKSAPTTHSSTNLRSAEYAFNELLQKKVKGKSGDAYDKVISPAIVPSQFGGAGFARAITKEEELKTSKAINSLHNFLAGVEVKTEEPQKVKKAKVNEGLSAMLAAFGDE